MIHGFYLTDRPPDNLIKWILAESTFCVPNVMQACGMPKGVRNAHHLVHMTFIQSIARTSVVLRDCIWEEADSRTYNYCTHAQSTLGYLHQFRREANRVSLLEILLLCFSEKGYKVIVLWAHLDYGAIFLGSGCMH